MASLVPMQKSHAVVLLVPRMLEFHAKNRSTRVASANRRVNEMQTRGKRMPNKEEGQ